MHFSDLIVVRDQEKSEDLGDWEHGDIYSDISILLLSLYLCFVSKTDGFIMSDHLL